ncbi:TetR/AcrR family transcriptional regulator [Saccharomonospora piscinae]|uniref:TetR/AcrR family transcriptional regulator n=1 Tax=Saccharomonospora piscinae TaxID=687388 RepID=UPI00046354C9|nr:TetR/AcrR family transcriptional regulator [Saccharomonospora piscinae]
MSENHTATQAATTTPLRRQPVQQRSAKRVERMLDASAELLDEVGYEGLTTTLIAKRAGVAVGSLYQFFPDKRAVVQALTQRNLERFITAVNDRLGTLDPHHWWDIVDSLLDIYLAMHRDVPGFSTVHFGDVVDLRLLDDRRTNNRVVVDALAGLVTTHLALSQEEVALPISIAVEAADGLLNYAFRLDPRGNQDVIDETKTLIKGYLASKFGD